MIVVSEQRFDDFVEKKFLRGATLLNIHHSKQNLKLQQKIVVRDELNPAKIFYEFFNS